MDKQELMRAVEAILFASGDPVSAERIALVLDCDKDSVLDAGQALAQEYDEQQRGIRLVRLNDSLQLHSAPEYATVITRALEQRRAPKLSQASLEVLAIVAYFQPVTRAYIEQMRGLDSSYTVGVLAERNLIEPCGHLETIGRPTLYRTTELFLRTMGISSLEELPPLPEMSGSDAATQLQQKVDALKAAEEAQQALEETQEEGAVQT
jgi:segregation and condensation protein B